jgi:hypothetical protein
MCSGLSGILPVPGRAMPVLRSRGAMPCKDFAALIDVIFRTVSWLMAYLSIIRINLQLSPW